MAATRRSDFELWARMTPPSELNIYRLHAHFSQVSIRQLYRLTHRYFNRSPQKWLDDERIELAPGALLRFGRAKDAAKFLGLEPARFNRLFKRRFHDCPKAYLTKMQLQPTAQLTFHFKGKPGFGSQG